MERSRLVRSAVSEDAGTSSWYLWGRCRELPVSLQCCVRHFAAAAPGNGDAADVGTLRQDRLSDLSVQGACIPFLRIWAGTPPRGI
eukprot:gene9264-biopygen8574